jgi:hypothetical protein
MHYYALAIIPAEGDIESQVEQAMAPYDENSHQTQRVTEDGESWMINPDGLWDWYQIGGRWTGTFDGYDPETDPANLETCQLCGGTGRRDDELARQWRASGEWSQDFGCNGCNGGKKVAWPTQWKFRKGDVILAEGLAELLTVGDQDGLIPHTIFVHEVIRGTVQYFARTGWNGSAWVDLLDKDGMRELLKGLLAEAPGVRVAVIDYHS